MNIYVANIPFSASEDQLNDLFSQHGQVSSARIITDKFTSQSRGFGFVEITDNTTAQAAIDALNGHNFMGKTLTVNEARPKTESSSYGNGGGGYKKSYGGGGNRY
ncbi:MAG: RNA-binding protein [Bacteroidetes bacterium]|nr:RNA-binding protein [Bacteroidota bacterium]